MRESQDPPTGTPPAVTGPGYERAFAAADALNVHRSGCVCPRCAGRLPGLLAELARAVGDVDRAGAR